MLAVLEASRMVGMAADEKLEEARRAAQKIVGLSAEEVSQVFYEEMKRRRLSRLVRRLDLLALEGGEDGRMAVLALSRLGFDPVEGRDR